MIRHCIMFLTAAVLGGGAAQAQFASSLEMHKRQHLLGEPVMVTLRVTNHSGRPQVFSSQSRIPWLSLMVKTSNGTPVNARHHPDFGAMQIEPGQTLAKKINLADYFMLERSGNFVASATIRAPESTLEGTSTNRVFFEQRAGRIQWAQKVGSSTNSREYRLLRFQGDQNSEYYAQVEDGNNGRLIRTFPLGGGLLIRKPMISIDNQQRMHVMFLHTPVLWLHYCIDGNGTVVSRDIHQRTSVGDPKMVTLPDGTIEVINSIPFDPVAIAKQRAEIRKITDRPEIPADTPE